MLKSGTIEVEGIEYRWSIYRQPMWVSERGFVGMAILVETMESSTRELLLEFAMDHSTGHRCMTSHVRFRISNRRLIECVQNAIRAGWNPNSRGKRFIFEAGSVNPS
jgi:hypothetical protein